MPETLNLNPHSGPTHTFVLRDEAEFEVPMLENRDGSVGLVDRQYLDELITGFGWVQREGPFPETFTEIDRIASNYPKDVFEAYRTAGGEVYGYKSTYLRRFIYTCGGQGGYDPADFAIYQPTGVNDGLPFLGVVTRYTPEEFVIHRLFGDEYEFAARFGAGACPACEEVFDQPFVNCPDCFERPDSVQANIEKLQEAHDGVVGVIAPSLQNGDDIDDGLIRGVGEYPDPQIEVIESPGAA